MAVGSLMRKEVPGLARLGRRDERGAPGWPRVVWRERKVRPPEDSRRKVQSAPVAQARTYSAREAATKSWLVLLKFIMA
jgi:hypothetical protein